MGKIKTITVSAGENTLSPISYNSFKYGGISATVEFDEDEEDITDVYKETRKVLAELVEKDFAFRKGQFFKHVEKAADDVQKRAASRRGT